MVAGGLGTVVAGQGLGGAGRLPVVRRLLVVLLRHDGWLRRLGLLGLGLFCGSLLVYSVNPASLFAAKESWSLARISMRAFGPLVMLVVGMACARLAHELR